eukprot:4597385-Pleurochrysis_carterae.AAC.1
MQHSVLSMMRLDEGHSANFRSVGVSRNLAESAIATLLKTRFETRNNRNTALSVPQPQIADTHHIASNLLNELSCPEDGAVSGGLENLVAAALQQFSPNPNSRTRSQKKQPRWTVKPL